MIKLLLLLLSTSLLVLTSNPHADTSTKENLGWTGCGNFDNWVNNGYTVTNDVWGSGAGPQCIWANSGTNWGVGTQQPSTNGVKSYPNSYKKINKKVSEYNGMGSWDYSVPSGSNFWNAAFDIWVPTEVMVWVGFSSGVGPRGSLQQSNVQIGGHNWNVYREVSSDNVVSFLRTSNSMKGSVNLGTMLNWARTKGWYADGTIGNNAFGFEISGTGSKQVNFTCHSMSIGD